MKNIVFVVIDTENEEQPVRVAKPDDYVVPEPKTKEDREATMLDNKTLIEGLIKNSYYMELMDYQSYEDTVDEIITSLKEGYHDYKNMTEGNEEEKND